jgi:fluoride exporter
MLKVILIFLGSGLGGVLRYSMQGWFQRLATGGFPVGTLAVNLTGCVLVGFLTALFTGPMLIREEYRVGLTIGVLGGFTTFSTFGLETFTLANAGQFWFAVLNVALSCGFGFVAVWIGYRAAEHFFGV